MPPSRQVRRVAAAAAGAVVATLLLAAAAVVGGAVTVVTTTGNSMEPSMREGDLVLVRPAPDYRVGDVAAYHSELLDTLVLHRIVDRDGDRFVLQGDNNTWLDPDRPGPDELVGRRWLHVPGSGRVTGMRGTAAIVLAVVGVLAIGGGRAARRRTKTSTPGGPLVKNTSTAARRLRRARTTATVGCALAVAASVLGAAAFTRPASVPDTQTIDYTHRGAFDYAASVPPSPVYQDGRVTTGDPVFLDLVQRLDVSFTYRLDAVAATSLTGTIGLDAEISDGTGWQRTITLQAPRTFDGATAEIGATLDIEPLRALAAEVAGITGASPGAHRIAVVPTVAISGQLAGDDLDDSFTPRLPLSLDSHRLRVDGSDGDAASALAPTSAGTLSTSRDVVGTISLAGRHLAVDHTRAVAGVVGAVAVVLMAAGIVVLAPAWRAQTARIELRHGRRLVPVTAAERDGSHLVLDLETMEDLTRLADQHGSLILHHDHDEHHDYLFQVDRTIYRYRVANRAQGSA